MYTFVDGEFRQSDAVHLGVAVALRGGGLVAPTIHDAIACRRMS
jgi:pyruvate dehydrogenase E2 component (dihydrolipoamide acetyltransferase)